MTLCPAATLLTRILSIPFSSIARTLSSGVSVDWCRSSGRIVALSNVGSKGHCDLWFFRVYSQ